MKNNSSQGEMLGKVKLSVFNGICYVLVLTYRKMSGARPQQRPHAGWGHCGSHLREKRIFLLQRCPDRCRLLALLEPLPHKP